MKLFELEKTDNSYEGPDTNTIGNKRNIVKAHVKRRGKSNPKVAKEARFKTDYPAASITPNGPA